jgi:2-polyprenyl-3-methyl-5-hydroxy-6-metoxy-1,4-benzoquinol methylase
MTALFSHPYFVLPGADVYTDPSRGSYLGDAHTYTHYNYLKRGPIARAKRRRFEIALQCYLPEHAGGTAIDMGCADGVFLPSLSKHFSRVVGIDIHSQMLATAGDVIRRERLDNVELFNSRSSKPDQILRSVPALPADVAFLLETLEHVGTPGVGAAVYGEKVEFLRNLFELLVPGGTVIMSIPRMVGTPYMLKHLIQSALRIPHEKVSTGDVLRAGFLLDTAALEPRWTGGHVGFNDLKLSRLLHENFVVEREWTTLISRFFILRREGAAASADSGLHRASDPMSVRLVA